MTHRDERDIGRLFFQRPMFLSFMVIHILVLNQLIIKQTHFGTL